MKDGLKKANFLNYSILIPYLLLSAIGIIMVFSTTVPYQLQHGLSPYRAVISQGAFMLISFVGMAIIYRMKLKALKSRKILIFILVAIISSLIICRIMPASFPLTAPVNGARGWIHIPGIGTIQPAEIAKIFVVWYLASTFSEKQEKLHRHDIKEVFKGETFSQKLIGGWRLPILSILLLDILMPDLGNAVILAWIVFTMIGASGISWHWFSGLGRMIFGLFIIIAIFAFSTKGNIIPITYIQKRFTAWVNPFQNQAVLANAGHQMANSYYAIANGGWFGRGLGNSIEKTGFLPESSTDFIFPIIIEELGVIGGILVLGILFFLIARILLVGIRARNSFNSLMALGIASLLLIQVFVNVGGAIGVIPETGVTFPFISQGGSSFLVLSLGVAFVLNISADEKRQEVTELTGNYQAIKY